MRTILLKIASLPNSVAFLNFYLILFLKLLAVLKLILTEFWCVQVKMPKERSF